VASKPVGDSVHHDRAVPTRVDRVLRWVWLINGVLLLTLLLFGAGFILVGALAGRSGGTTPSTAGGDSTRAPRASEAIRYDPPQQVRGGSSRLVLIRRGSGYSYSSTASAASAGGEGAVVNVAFLDGAGARLLLDRPAFVRRVRFPGDEAAQPGAGTDLRWIVYEMALRDSNGDRAVDDRDRRGLYVTDLEGRTLRRVLPEGFELRDWAAQADGSLLVTGLDLGAADGSLRQRAFVLDREGTVRAYAALDSVAAMAGRISGGR
jgi:hypothetical protein